MFLLGLAVADPDSPELDLCLPAVSCIDPLMDVLDGEALVERKAVTSAGSGLQGGSEVAYRNGSAVRSRKSAGSVILGMLSPRIKGRKGGLAEPVLEVLHRQRPEPLPAPQPAEAALRLSRP